MGWIELNDKDGTKCSVRSEQIVAFQAVEGKTMVAYEVGADVSSLVTTTPYDDVKKKIEAAEHIDLENLRVKRFTQKEYETLEYCLTKYLETIDNIEELEKYAKLQNKLNIILKEKE